MCDARPRGNALLSKKGRHIMVALAGGRCVYCASVLRFGALSAKQAPEADHLIAHTNGGSDSPKYLAAVCKSCNSSRRASRLLNDAGEVCWWLPTRLVELGICKDWTESRALARVRIRRAFKLGRQLHAALEAIGRTK